MGEKSGAISTIRRWKPRNLSLLTFSLLLSGCADNGLPNYYELGDLRVLGILAENSLSQAISEVDPSSGPTVTFTPVISALDAGIALGNPSSNLSLTLTWQSCTDPGVSNGASPSCEGVPGASAITTANGTLPSQSGSYTGILSVNGTHSVTLPSTFLDSASNREKQNGVNLLVTLQVTVPSTGETVKSFRRITATTRSTLNSVPAITGVRTQGSGSNLTALPATESELVPVYTGSAETYSLISSSGVTVQLTENLTTTWFLSRGELESNRTDTTLPNTYTPATQGTTPQFLVALLRDSRGGLSWQKVGP